MKRILCLALILFCTTAYADKYSFYVVGPIDNTKTWILSRHSHYDICAVTTSHKPKVKLPVDPKRHDLLTFMYVKGTWNIILGKTDMSAWEAEPDQFVNRFFIAGGKIWGIQLKVMKTGLWSPIKAEFLADLIKSPEMIVRTQDNELIGRFPTTKLLQALYAAYQCSLASEA